MMNAIVHPPRKESGERYPPDDVTAKTVSAASSMHTIMLPALFVSVPRAPAALPATRASLSLAHGRGFLSRRAICAGAISSALAVPNLCAHAAEYKTYANKEYGVSFDVPSSWTVSESELSGSRKLIIAADPSDIDFNAFIAFTPIAGDYSSLGSFGNLESVGATVLPQCSSGLCTLAADNIEGKMLSSESVKGSYVFDYLITTSSSPQRHLRSLFSIKNEPTRATSTLVTLTAQCLQDRYDSASETLKTVCDSFKYI
ncbi:hypothetical protein AB1Y20_022954 [Prymnesium parvum]|uniref:PsbP C-terminal domain-containing protein n=1 Tax=Prymnesium parvum TaxID=97485 RepID=A0AB34JD00_PRYPA